MKKLSIDHPLLSAAKFELDNGLCIAAEKLSLGKEVKLTLTIDLAESPERKAETILAPNEKITSLIDVSCKVISKETAYNEKTNINPIVVGKDRYGAVVCRNASGQLNMLGDDDEA